MKKSYIITVAVALLLLAEGLDRASAQTLTTLWQFNGTDGSYPNGGLVQGSDGNFYGTTEYGGTNDYDPPNYEYGEGTVLKITTQGTLTTLWQFGSSPTDGKYPTAGLVQGSDGYFYGTTYEGGTNGLPYGEGTVFRISSAGTLTTLWQFGSSPTDGKYPTAGLVQGSDGYFYGTTWQGGTNNEGTVFKITTQGTLTTLHQFGSGPIDGVLPEAGLVEGSDGYFYGTTYYGVSSTGVVFRISSAGTLTTLYQFGSSPTDGRAPWAGLMQGSDGYFYGTTYRGGTNFIVYNGYADYLGTVFKITSQGTLTTLWQFGSSPTDGEEPAAGLVQGSDGYFYGTTYFGGTNYDGVVFRISSAGALTTLWQFGGSPTDGTAPFAGLVQGSDGYFYGTTTYGGTNNLPYGAGTVFRISSAGTLTTLWQFGSSPTDGKYPIAGLVQGSDGYFYGTTWQGGTNNEGVVFQDGVVFQLSVPLSPPANQIAGIEFFSVFGDTYTALLIPSVAGETYQLQYSDSMNPTNWINSGDPITSIGGPLSTFDLVEPMMPQRFYRFTITP